MTCNTIFVYSTDFKISNTIAIRDCIDASNQSILRVNHMTADNRTVDKTGYILACQLGKKINPTNYLSEYRGSNRKKVWTWVIRTFFSMPNQRIEQEYLRENSMVLIEESVYSL